MPLKLCLFLMLAFCAITSVPTGAQQLTFDQLVKASKESLRDTAELPMRLKVEFSATDLTGRVRKHKTGKFDYDFHGFNPHSNNGSLNLHGSRGTIKAAGTTATVTMLPSLLLPSNGEPRLKMKIIDSPEPDILAAEFLQEDSLEATHVKWETKEKPASGEKPPSGQKCQTSEWMQEAYIFKNICLGRGQMQLQKDDLSMKSFAWDTGGLPQSANVDYLGEANVNDYRVDIDFQKVTLPGDPKPFVVPRHVTVTVVTDKGKLLMVGEFSLKK